MLTATNARIPKQLAKGERHGPYIANRRYVLITTSATESDVGKIPLTPDLEGGRPSGIKTIEQLLAHHRTNNTPATISEDVDGDISFDSSNVTYTVSASLLAWLARITRSDSFRAGFGYIEEVGIVSLWRGDELCAVVCTNREPTRKDAPQ
jgi:hypothetical protein